LKEFGSVFRIFRFGKGTVFPVKSANAAPGRGFLAR